MVGLVEERGRGEAADNGAPSKLEREEEECGAKKRERELFGDALELGEGWSGGCGGLGSGFGGGRRRRRSNCGRSWRGGFSSGSRRRAPKPGGNTHFAKL